MPRGVCPPPIYTCWTSTIQPSLGSTCVATSVTARIGPAESAWCPLPAGGCDVAEDPELDGRVAQPLWLASTEGLLHVRAMRAHGAATRRFDLWGIPGRKRLAMDGHDLALTADLSALRMRLSLSGTLEDGCAYVGAVPLTPGLRGQLDGYREQAQALEGHAPQISPVRSATRAALLHLRAMQALDASQAGASHRDIAKALFGLEAVVLRWSEDGELRAQVRHLLRRVEFFMNGGYLSLAGVLDPAAKPPGDEPVR